MQSRVVRSVIAVCAIAAMLMVSAVASSSAHIHTKVPAGQCDICFTVHVVSAEPVAIVQLFQTPEIEERLLARDVIAGYRLPTLRSAVDRGPPSL